MPFLLSFFFAQLHIYDKISIRRFFLQQQQKSLIINIVSTKERFLSMKVLDKEKRHWNISAYEYTPSRHTQKKAIDDHGNHLTRS